MCRCAVLGAVVWLLTTGATVAQTEPKRSSLVERCESLVLLQRDAAKQPNREFRLDIRQPDGTRLLYVGVQHTTDPTSPQVADIASLWDSLKPTAAFYEGLDTFIADTLPDSVQRAGEPAALRFLARRDHVPVRTLEPPTDDEARYLLNAFSREQVGLFYILRDVWSARSFQQATGDWVAPVVDQSLNRLRRRMPSLSGVFPDTSTFRSAYDRWFPTTDMAAVPAAWFDPLAESANTGGRFMNDVSRAGTMFRDLHMFRVLADSMTAGGRVFAEVGRDHIPAQAAALRCAMDARQ